MVIMMTVICSGKTLYLDSFHVIIINTKERGVTSKCIVIDLLNRISKNRNPIPPKY